MLSMIQINCPHCHAKGQVMVPPIGSLVVGPCPQCHGLVAIFCGSALPLDKEVFEHGSHEDRKEHLMSVLISFLASRIEPVIDQIGQDGPLGFTQDANEDAQSPLSSGNDESSDDGGVQHSLFEEEPITTADLRRFVTNELPRLDNSVDFRRIFGPPTENS